MPRRRITLTPEQKKELHDIMHEPVFSPEERKAMDDSLARFKAIRREDANEKRRKYMREYMAKKRATGNIKRLEDAVATARSKLAAAEARLAEAKKVGY